jgi:hypothetical protein
LTCSQQSKAFNFFGLQSKKLQEVLSKRVAEPAVEVPPPKRRGVLARTTVKAVAASIGTQESKEQDLKFTFGPDASRKSVRAMIAAMESSLIANKDPERRARQIISQFVDHPDMKKLLHAWVEDSFKWDRKQMEVLMQVVENIRLAIEVHKDLRNKESGDLMQVVFVSLSDLACDCVYSVFVS